jgi:hypothetical protein
MKQLFFTFSLLFAGSFLSAQNHEVVASAGGYDTTSTVKISWTVGETVTETITDNNNIVTQGFHQTNLTATQIEENLIYNVNFAVNVYPNPTVEFVNVEIKADNLEEVVYELNDNNGKLLLKGSFKTNIEKINFENYKPSVYYLRIYNNKGNFSDTYKIVKGN